MKKQLLAVLAMAVAPVCAFAVDGVTLINQSTVMAAGGFPYQITQPGSYKLSGNLVVSTLVDGIDVTATNVTLDLNGFMIQGPGPAACPLCFGVLAKLGEFTLRNGAVTNFGFGVVVRPPGHGIVTDIQASGNGTGIAGTALVIVGCAANLNSDTGFDTIGSTVLDSVANRNKRAVISTQSTLLHNVFNNNTFEGISALGSAFGRNMALNNGSGVDKSLSSSVTDLDNLATGGVLW